MRTRFSAEVYAHHASVQRRWGQRLAQAATIVPQVVIDAGCGTGASTTTLLKHFPDAHIIAFDIDERMVRSARRSLAHEAADGRAHFVVADVGAGAVTTRAAADLVFSVATFHWVLDHTQLWSNVGSMLRRSGVAFAEYGGSGNLASVEEVIGAALRNRHFASVAETNHAVRAAGLVARSVTLRPDPQYFESRASLRDSLAALVMHEYSAEDIDAVARALPTPRLDWVRLEVVAERKE